MTSSKQPKWLHPPTQLSLPPSHVHVWRTRLDLPEKRVEVLAALLSRDEAERARRFKSEEAQRRYVVGRGWLREILAGYLGISPGTMEFGYTQQMKPYLSGSDLCFNLSHSGELAVVAIVRRKRIGVDIEFVRRLTDIDQMAERYFAEGEREAYRSLPEAQKVEGFFNCWTRKEAFVKAIGEGLTLPLEGFEVSLAPTEPARLLAVKDAPEESGRWKLIAFTPGDGYIGAVAVEASDVEVMWWEAGENLRGSDIE